MASSPQHEPTMEEILASIRKIISEDSGETPAPPAEPVAMAPPTPEEHSEADVLELTQEVHEEPAPEPAPYIAPAPLEEPPMEMVQAVHPEPEPEPIAPEPVHAEIHEPKPADEVVFQTIEEPAMTASDSAQPSNEIFSDKTRKAIDDAFATLDVPEPEAPAAPPPPPAPMAAPSSAPAGSVESVFERAVREAVGPHVDQWMAGQKTEILASLQPMIREWMDEHFPAILEGAVRDEVARAVKARGR